MLRYKIANVVLPLALDKDFDYVIPPECHLRKGDRVLVDFGGSKRPAMVVDFKKESSVKYLKPVIKVLDSFLVPEHIEFAVKLSQLYPYAMGEFLFMMLPPAFKRLKKPFLTSAAEDKNRDYLAGSPQKVNNIFVKGDSFLHRYGWWKKKAEEKLKCGSVLVCFPQTSYLKEARAVIEKDFPGALSVIYSQQTEKDLLESWRGSRKNALILCTRVALFYYPGDLSLIIMEEENSAYYFQEEKPFYYLLDVILLLSKIKNIDVVLSGDYPTLAAYKLIEEGEFKMENIAPADSARLKVVDIGGSRAKVITPVFQELVRKNLSEGRRIVVIWNRRGAGSYLGCSSCGDILKCRRCSGFLQVSLKDENTGVCPYCSGKVKLARICGKCGSGYIKSFGLGMEKIEVILKRIFPEAKISKWEEHNSDTQVIITTSKILSALYGAEHFDTGFLLDTDYSFSRLDYEAIFNAFIYIKKLSLFFKDSLYLFTRNPQHYLFENIADNWRSFYRRELELRKALLLPPLGNIVKIVIRAKDENKLLKKSQDIYNRLKDKGLNVYGPLAEIPFKLRGYYRYAIIIKGQNRHYLQEMIKDDIKNIRKTHIKLAVIIR